MIMKNINIIAAYIARRYICLIFLALPQMMFFAPARSDAPPPQRASLPDADAADDTPIT